MAKAKQHTCQYGQFFLECQIARVQCTGSGMWRMIGSARSQQHAPQMEWKRCKVRGSWADGNGTHHSCQHATCRQVAIISNAVTGHNGPASPLPPPATPIDSTTGRHELSPIGNAAYQIACKHPIPGQPLHANAQAPWGTPTQGAPVIDQARNPVRPDVSSRPE